VGGRDRQPPNQGPGPTAGPPGAHQRATRPRPVRETAGPGHQARGRPGPADRPAPPLNPPYPRQTEGNVMPDFTYGFIGLGNMGGPMAGRLLDAGYALAVYDSNGAAIEALRQRGARPCASIRELCDSVDTVFLSLPTPEIVQQVTLGADGVIGGTRVNRVVDLSTIGPRTARLVARSLAERNITYIDAPVSGGVGGARRGTLAVMAACERSHYDLLAPTLKHFGPAFYLGAEPGMGQTMKLANNLLSAAAVAITSEAMAMGVKAGLDPAVMLDVINAGSGRNTATQDKDR